MKNRTAKFSIILLAIALALSVAGCDTTGSGPEAEPTPSPTPRPSPVPTLTPTPEPTPAPTPGLLQFEEIYYMNGDRAQMGIAFFADGTSMNSSGAEARYETDGAKVSIFYEDEWDSDLWVIDEFTLEEVETGIRFIRENGDGFGGVTDIPSGSRDIFFETYYYIDGYIEGEEDVSSLYFYDFGEVVITGGGAPELGEYTIFNGWIMITVRSEERMVLRIMSAAELVDDDTSEVYALVGALEGELVLDERYYQFGEAGEISMVFQEEGEFVFAHMEDVIGTGTYTVEGDRITVVYDGEETEIAIVNNYVLYLVNQEVQFIRIPYS